MFLVVGVAADLSHINTAAKVSRSKAFVIRILQLQAALARMNTVHAKDSAFSIQSSALGYSKVSL